MIRLTPASVIDLQLKVCGGASASASARHAAWVEPWCRVFSAASNSKPKIGV
jgi:hypothetical protein